MLPCSGSDSMFLLKISVKLQVHMAHCLVGLSDQHWAVFTVINTIFIFSTLAALFTWLLWPTDVKMKFKSHVLIGTVHYVYFMQCSFLTLPQAQHNYLRLQYRCSLEHGLVVSTRMFKSFLHLPCYRCSKTELFWHLLVIWWKTVFTLRQKIFCNILK
jgi:hypothetical protein